MTEDWLQLHMPAHPVTLQDIHFQVPFRDAGHEAFHLTFRGSPCTSDVLEHLLALVRLLESRGVFDIEIATLPYGELAREARSMDGPHNKVQFSLVVSIADHEAVKNALYAARSHTADDVERIRHEKSPIRHVLDKVFG